MQKNENKYDDRYDSTGIRVSDICSGVQAKDLDSGQVKRSTSHVHMHPATYYCRSTVFNLL